MALLGQIALTRQDELYILGDYIDRGRESRSVIERIIILQSQGYPIRHWELVDSFWSDGGRKLLKFTEVKSAGTTATTFQ